MDALLSAIGIAIRLVGGFFSEWLMAGIGRGVIAIVSPRSRPDYFDCVIVGLLFWLTLIVALGWWLTRA